ncbi:glycosyltransferase family 4 protein [Alkalibacillus filiformis]|nr:glycosyltransferase family 4 protein [Alkalibacillus filiformis]
MKICHLTSVHKYNDIRITVKECTTLVNAGYDVHLIAPNTRVKEFNGVTIHGLFNNYNGRLNRIKKFTKQIYQKAVELDADVYHFHDPELIPVGLKLKRKGKNVIYDIHEDVPRQIMSKSWIPKPLRKSVSSVFERYENNSAKKFDALIVATPFIKKRFYNVNENSVNVNNYPILSEMHIDHSETFKKRQIAYIGGISKARGSITMAKAINNTSAKLVLAGSFLTKTEENEFYNHITANNIKHLGFIDREEIKNTLSESLAGLVILEPKENYLDSLPIKMFEYMSASIPVIASNFPLWKNIIEKNNCGICVNPLNEDEIAEAIQWIIDNPKEAKKMGENGRLAVENYFNWEQESIKLIGTYKDIDL